MPRAIRRAGFVPAQMRLSARGIFVADEAGTSFRIRGWQRLFDVRASAAAPDGEVELRAVVDYSGRAAVLRPLPGWGGSSRPH